MRVALRRGMGPGKGWEEGLPSFTVKYDTVSATLLLWLTGVPGNELKFAKQTHFSASLRQVPGRTPLFARLLPPFTAPVPVVRWRQVAEIGGARSSGHLEERALCRVEVDAT